MNKTDNVLNLSNDQIKNILLTNYNLNSDTITLLYGEFDYNYKISAKKHNYLLKISRDDNELDNISFQNVLLNFLNENSKGINLPQVIRSTNGKDIIEIRNTDGSSRFVRLLSWMEGRLFSKINPTNEKLLFNLGEHAGLITKHLQKFDHPFSHRKFDWDNANVEWTKDHLNLFELKQREILEFFLNEFLTRKPQFDRLRKSVIHNDVNDNNIIVSDDLIDQKIESIIDYGDSVYTQTINDLAICIAYAAMNKPDPLEAALNVVIGYNKSFSLTEEEISFLYTLTGIRLVISVTKSAINKQKEPGNEYLQISEKPAWALLKKWKDVDEKIATYLFRNACGYTPHPKEREICESLSKLNIDPSLFFPSIQSKSFYPIDMSVSSKFLGTSKEYNDTELLSLKLKKVKYQNPDKLIAGGYLETRPIYITDAYKKEGNSGPEYRCVHLGVDFWVEGGTPLHSILDGKVFSIYDNNNDKDYGPTLILEHTNEETFYTLYGHLSKSTLELHSVGDKISKGDLLGYIGNGNENGNWAPHLHFQIILDMLNYKNDFTGVAFQKELDIWKSICPDPNIIFQNSELEKTTKISSEKLIADRKNYLGRSLSLSYSTPLHIVRGQGQHLISDSGRKYLDTVNNVAHVGHEHPRIVEAAQEQISLLNTNTRYLNENINEFAKELLSTFPKELSVVHFVNSGSEANELALRMAKTFTNQKDMIAVEIGYHGNTSGCVDVSSYKFDGKGGKGSPEHTHIIPLPDEFRGIYTDKDCGIKYANHIDEKIEKIKFNNRGLAGFICESIISCGGQIELPKNYLSSAYEKIRNEGGVCIADEVQVGLGRVGEKFWAFELHNVIPDIVTIGKPLGNGHPLAAVICTPQIADSFNNGMEYFNTFGGNPVSCTIGKTVLKIIRDENLQINALETGKYLIDGLYKLQNSFPIIGDVRGKGLFLGFELVNKYKNPETAKASYLVNRMKELGILMSTDGKDNNVLKIKPPIIFSKNDVDELMFRLEQVFNEDFMRF